MAGDHADISKHVRLYITIFVALAALTIVTVLASFVHLGSHSNNILFGMFVALVKASLVAAVFMHLKWERRIIFWTLLLCFMFFGLLMLVPLLTTMDTMNGR